MLPITKLFTTRTKPWKRTCARSAGQRRAIHRTGAIYRKDNRTDQESLTRQPARPVGEWNDYEVRVDGEQYTVTLNGTQVCMFNNTGLYPGRGLPSTTGAPSFIGLQVYANPKYFVRYRSVRIKALP